MSIVDVAKVLGELKAYSAVNAEMQRLRSINAELVKAFKAIVTEAEREDTNPASSCNRIAAIANVALERAKQ